MMTPTTKYVKGRAIEYKVAAFLKGKGYAVTRAAGSKGVFDVIAYNGRVVRFIQVKLTAKRNINQYKIELDSIFDTPVPESFCTRELWVYVHNIGFTDAIFVGMPPMDYSTAAEHEHWYIAGQLTVVK